MSDAFADLWKSSTPSPSASTQRLGNLTPASSASGGSNLGQRVGAAGQRDAFDVLAFTSSPSSGIGRSSSNLNPTRPPLRSTTSQTSVSATSIKPPAASVSTSSTAKGNSDAFSSLLQGSFAGGSTSNMTIAERAAKKDIERKEALQREHATKANLANTTATQWAGLDSLGSSDASPIPAADADDWLFGTTQSTSAAGSSTPSRIPTRASEKIDDEDDWGLGDFGASTSHGATTTAATTTSLSSNLTGRQANIWESLDDSLSPPPDKSNGRSRPDSPSRDFDFGNREDGLLDDVDDNDDRDDILGALGKPVTQPQSRSSSSSSPQPRQYSSPPLPPRTRTGNVSTPPPHILGKLVEMGFGIDESTAALASTSTGVDVEAALEILISNGAGSRASSTPPTLPPRTANGRATQRERQRNTPSPSSNAILRERDRDRARKAASSEPSSGDAGFSADKLLAQTTSFGLSFLAKANAAWKDGREMVQKVVEEKMASASASSTPAAGSGESSGRPKWMQDGAGWESDDEDSDARKRNSKPMAKPQQNSFRDDVEEERFDEHPRPRNVRSSPRPDTGASPSPDSQPLSTKQRIANLFSDEPVAYVPASRRGTPRGRERDQNLSAQAAAAASSPRVTTPAPPIRPPVRTRQPRKNLISATSHIISTSNTYKSNANSLFSLGRYAEAEASYTKAIDSLPDGHLLLVHLFNNRAACRLKNGDYDGAVGDTSGVVSIVVCGNEAGWNPEFEEPVTAPSDGAGVDLSAGLVKAYKRRAEAYEGKERWDDALGDWERVVNCPWVGVKERRDALQGVGRCKKMKEPKEEKKVTDKPKPKVVPTPRRGPTPPSQALNALRAANASLEAEDAAKLNLKDSVDSRLLAWKGGKETNIRALLASLDLVLWQELLDGLGKKIGMSDLVMENQVKKWYVKVIARVHPDKLNAGNSTLEQRMLANGVFGALNEAWNAFKP